MEKTGPVIVARTWMNTEASVIKSLMASYNIPCYFTSELPHQIYPLSGEGLTEIRIYVPASLAEAARRVLVEHRRRDATLRLVEVDETPDAESLRQNDGSRRTQRSQKIYLK